MSWRAGDASARAEARKGRLRRWHHVAAFARQHQNLVFESANLVGLHLDQLRQSLAFFQLRLTQTTTLCTLSRTITHLLITVGGPVADTAACLALITGDSGPVSVPSSEVQTIACSLYLLYQKQLQLRLGYNSSYHAHCLPFLLITPTK